MCHVADECSRDGRTFCNQCHVKIVVIFWAKSEVSPDMLLNQADTLRSFANISTVSECRLLQFLLPTVAVSPGPVWEEHGIPSLRDYIVTDDFRDETRAETRVHGKRVTGLYALR